MRCIQVGVCRETVVIDAESQMGYVVRSGYDMGNVYLVKKFNPSGMDIRMLDYSSILGERIKPDSSEYAPVIEAIGWSKPSLEGFGAPGKVLFPAGYKVK